MTCFFFSLTAFSIGRCLGDSDQLCFWCPLHKFWFIFFPLPPQTNKQTNGKTPNLIFISPLKTLNTKASQALQAFPTRGGGWGRGGGCAAKCEAACRAKSRQALCKANTASRRLVLVSGRLVSLALFIVSATRHLLETRLCPPVSTEHCTEGACQHCPSTSSLLPFPRQSVFPRSGQTNCSLL